MAFSANETYKEFLKSNIKILWLAHFRFFKCAFILLVIVSYEIVNWF